MYSYLHKSHVVYWLSCQHGCLSCFFFISIVVMERSTLQQDEMIIQNLAKRTLEHLQGVGVEGRTVC
jgi:hypothetical protein